MTLQRALRLSVTILTLVAFSALVGTGKSPAVVAAGGFLALAISLAQECEWGPGRHLFHLTRMVWNGMLVIACLVTVMDYLWGTHNALQASLYVLVFLMTNKLLTLARLKDIPQLFVIG